MTIPELLDAVIKAVTRLLLSPFCAKQDPQKTRGTSAQDALRAGAQLPCLPLQEPVEAAPWLLSFSLP